MGSDPYVGRLRRDTSVAHRGMLTITIISWSMFFQGSLRQLHQGFPALNQTCHDKHQRARISIHGDTGPLPGEFFPPT